MDKTSLASFLRPTALASFPYPHCFTNSTCYMDSVWKFSHWVFIPTWGITFAPTVFAFVTIIFCHWCHSTIFLCLPYGHSVVIGFKVYPGLIYFVRDDAAIVQATSQSLHPVDSGYQTGLLICTTPPPYLPTLLCYQNTITAKMKA